MIVIYRGLPPCIQISIRSGVGSCIALITLFHFFTLTNFFWMLVEGLYLYMLVVKTFSGDNLRFNIYASIGWGKCCLEAKLCVPAN